MASRMDAWLQDDPEEGEWREPEPFEPFLQNGPPEERHTYDGWRQVRIKRGVCPRFTCGEPIVDGACPRCGWKLSDERPLADAAPEEQE